MSKKYIYPTAYEIKEVLSKMTNREFVIEFAKKRGIFMSYAKQDEIAYILGDLFFEEADIEEIREEAYQMTSKNTLSGFVIKSTDKDFNLPSLYETIRREGKQETGQVLSQIVESIDDDGSNVFKGQLEYEKHKIGRIEFLHIEKSLFDLYMKEIESGVWKVELDCSKSTDMKNLKKLLEKNTDNKNTEIITLEQGYLSTTQSIDFFDELAKKGLGTDWEFSDITQLTFKRNNEEEGEEAQKGYLTGIRQAILEGTGLRENSFVIQSVESGYKFTSMAYAYKKDGHIIEIKAEFKGRPKVFEVSIVSFHKVIGVMENLQNEKMSSTDKRKYRSLFWNTAKDIYDDLIKQ